MRARTPKTKASEPATTTITEPSEFKSDDVTAASSSADLSPAEAAPVAPDRERKERVIHTRVPAVLEAELKRFADNLRVPVSNLIRTILEDAVAVADRAGQSVERELLTVAQRVGNERERMRGAIARLDPLDGVYGFQPLILNVRAFCARCSAALEPGTAAHCALSAGDGPRRFVCNTCLPGAASGEPPLGEHP